MELKNAIANLRQIERGFKSLGKIADVMEIVEGIEEREKDVDRAVSEFEERKRVAEEKAIVAESDLASKTAEITLQIKEHRSRLEEEKNAELSDIQSKIEEKSRELYKLEQEAEGVSNTISILKVEKNGFLEEIKKLKGTLGSVNNLVGDV